MRIRTLSLLSIIACTLASCNSGQNTYEIYPVQDNLSPRLMGRALFPEAPDSLITELGLEEGIPASVCAFLVKTDGKEILFDAANGAPDSQLPTVLGQIGLSHADIDCIFITHMHGDHTNGLISFVDLLSWYFSLCTIFFLLFFRAICFYWVKRIFVWFFNFRNIFLNL